MKQLTYTLIVLLVIHIGWSVFEKIADAAEDIVSKTMDVENNEGSLSRMSFLLKEEAFTKITSTLTTSDATNFWNDVLYLEKMTEIKTLHLYLNSGGGDAFSGLSLASEIEKAKRKGFTVIAHASGLVASAAVPVFAVCSKRFAARGTIFMVHETSMWKWPGNETHSDIKSQNKLMNLLREKYMDIMVKYSTKPRAEWEVMEKDTTWFSAEKAKSWGLVDELE